MISNKAINFICSNRFYNPMIEAPMSEDDLDVSSDYLEEYHGKDAYNDGEDQNEDTEEEEELVEGERQEQQNQQSDEISFNPPAAHAITKPAIGDKTLEESKGEPFDI